MTARTRRTTAALSAVLGIALTAGVVAAAPRLDAWGALDHDLVTSQVSQHVVQTSTVLACPGPAELPDDDRTAAAQRSTVHSVLGLAELTPGARDEVLPVTSTRDGAEAATAPSDATASLEGASPLAVLGSSATSGPGPWAVRATAAASDAASEPARPVAAISHLASSGDLRGLAAGACLEPATDQWIVAGETQPGSSATLMLDNPGRTTVTVTLSLWGAGGPLAPAGSTTFVVPALGHESVLLSTLAPEERRLALRITSTGGAVGATLAESRLDGVVPRGTTLVPAGAPPANAQVVPGVVLETSEVDATDAGVLRLLAPDTATTATLTLLGTGGREVVRGSETVALAAGEVTDVSLAGVRAGTYTAVVSADAPVLAGARVVRSGPAVTESSGQVAVTVGTSADVAWLPSSTLLREGGAQGAGDAVPTSAAVVPGGLAADVVLTPVPSALHAHLAALDDVPVDYGDGTPDPRAAVARGTVEAYDGAGRLVGSTKVSAPLGATVTLSLSSLAPGAVVSVVRVTSDGAAAAESTASEGVDLAWTTVVASAGVPGSIDAVAPRSPEPTSRAVTVRQSTTVGR